MTPTPLLRIDFVSDVSCPWCVIGLKALDQALLRLQGEVQRMRYGGAHTWIRGFPV